MLSDTLKKILDEFPNARDEGDEAFAGHPLGTFVRRQARDEVLDAARDLSPRPENLRAKGSIGDVQRWTLTPWIAVMDERETTTVQEGVYVVYLFAADCEEVYLTVNQGCTTLYNAQPRQKEELTKRELRRRAEVMRGRLPPRHRLMLDDIELRGDVWRSRLYEAGTICGVRYPWHEIPDDDILRADLQEGLEAYAALLRSSTWASDDSVIEEASQEGVGSKLTEARVYRQHRKIERSSKTATRVKRALGHQCMACEVEMSEVYGDLGSGYIEAHHLKPLSTYQVDEQVELDIRRDFAVLCANCHRMIHRMENTGDVDGLRQIIGGKRLGSR